MNREIKFRVWDKENNKMLHYDNDIVPCITLNGVLQDCSREVSSNVSHKYELMQFTGLHDKNGVEIYEGDICLGIHYEDFDTGIGINVLSMNGEPFEVKLDDNVQGWNLYGYDKYEVIGNIYQNKDLIL